MIFLRSQRSKLEALFRSKAQGTGSVSARTFQAAVLNLIQVLGLDHDEAAVRSACEGVDEDGNGRIEIEEMERVLHFGRSSDFLARVRARTLSVGAPGE